MGRPELNWRPTSAAGLSSGLMGTRELYAFRQVAVNDALYIPFGLNAFADPIADLAGVIETQKGKFRVVRVTLRPGKFKAYLGHQAKLARVYRNKEEALGPLWSVA